MFKGITNVKIDPIIYIYCPKVLLSSRPLIGQQFKGLATARLFIMMSAILFQALQITKFKSQIVCGGKTPFYRKISTSFVILRRSLPLKFFYLKFSMKTLYISKHSSQRQNAETPFKKVSSVFLHHDVIFNYCYVSTKLIIYAIKHLQKLFKSSFQSRSKLFIINYAFS